MPFRRCRNFEDNGSRKTRSNGSEIQCLPNCQFIHPSDPDWDRAPTVAARGRGGPPQGGRGRGRSSFGPPASGANASTPGQEWGSSSGAWNDYMTDFDRNPRATSGSRGAPSRRSSQTRPESSGWGSSASDGPGWGSSANNSENPSNGWSNEPGVLGEQASSSQRDTQAGGWGSSGNGWGSSGNGWGPSGNGWGPSGDGWGSSGNGLESSGNGWGSSGNKLGSGSGWGSADNAWGSIETDQGHGWGGTSISDQGSRASPATAVAKIAKPDAVLRGTGVNGNSDAATSTSPSSPISVAVVLASQTDVRKSGGAKPVRVAIPSILMSGGLDPVHNEESGEDTLEPATPLATKSTKMRPPHVDHGNYFISTLSDTDHMGFATAVTLKMRELDAELSQLSALRKSRQVVATRAATELLQNKIHSFTDARVATEVEHNFCSGKLAQPDFLCRSNVQHALATPGRDNEQLERFNDWVSSAETCLSHVGPPSRPNSPIKKSNGATSISKLDLLKGRSESLAETILQCQDQQSCNILDHQIQEKMDSIMAAITRSLDISYNHLISASLIPLQRQGEMSQQILQSQAEKFAQVLLQSDQLKQEQKNQSSLKQKDKGVIQQADMVQKRSQLQGLQEEIAQLHHILTLIKEQQQSCSTINTLDEYAKHVQEYTQSYIQANATFLINAELSKAMIQFTATELKTVEKVWKTLQPLSQMSLWLQHSDIHKAEEEMEIKEIEEFLLT